MSKKTQFVGGEFIETFSNFDEGMTSNLRSSFGVAEIANGFAYKDKIFPKIELTDETPAPTNYQIIALAQRGEYTGSEPRIWGVGLAGTHGTVVSKDDFWSGDWVSRAVLATYTPVVRTPAIIYKRSLYFFADENRITRVLADTSATVTENWENGFEPMHGVGSTPVVGKIPYSFVYHPEYDILYILDKHHVSQSDNGTSSQNILTLDENKTLTCGSPYGQFLAMGQYDSATASSSVLIWNVDTGNPFVETVPWGDGELIALGELNGYLVGVTLEASIYAGNQRKMVFKRYNGSTIEELGEALRDNIIYSGSYNLVQPYCDGRKLYFMGLNSYDGSSEGRDDGILSIDYQGRLQLELRVAGVVDDNNEIHSFIKRGNLWAVAHSTDYQVDMTNSSNTDLGDITSVTSLVCDGNEPGIEKQLTSIRVSHEALPSGAEIVVEYKKPGDTTWTLIGTKSETGSYRSTFNKLQVGGGNLPSFFEILIRVSSTGGAVIKPFEVRSTIKSSDKIKT